MIAGLIALLEEFGGEAIAEEVATAIEEEAPQIVEEGAKPLTEWLMEKFGIPKETALLIVGYIFGRKSK